MPDTNSRFNVLIGTIYAGSIMTTVGTFGFGGSLFVGTIESSLFPIRDMAVVSNHGYPLIVQSVFSVNRSVGGNNIVTDRRNPTHNLTYFANAFGDDTEGTPFDGSGGIIQPSDSPGGTTASTLPVSSGGWLRIDLGPGLDVSHLHP